jgi:hypothetical protein
MVMLGFAFSKMAMSSTHSLCCTGSCAAGGAQSMEMVTGLLLELPLPDDPLLLLLEQAPAARTSPTAVTDSATER